MMIIIDANKKKHKQTNFNSTSTRMVSWKSAHLVFTY